MLARVERLRADDTPLGTDAIRRCFTTEEIRQSGLFGMYLAEVGLIVDSATRREELSELRRIEALLAEVRAKPWGALIKAYDQSLGPEGRKLRPRTRRCYLRAATELMAASDVTHAKYLTSEHVQTFLRSRPGHRASTFPWLSFLSQETGQQYVVPKARRRSDPTIRSVAVEVRDILAAIQATSSKRCRRALTAKLLSVTYAFPLEHVLTLGLTNVDTTEERVRLMLGDDWIAIQPPIADLVVSLSADAKRTGTESAKLFPGRFAGDSMSVAAVSYFLQKRRSLATPTQSSRL
jgi:hypothetical protein